MTTEIDVDGWSEDQCRDWLASHYGWELKPYGKGHIWFPKDYPDTSVCIRDSDSHPIPATLEEASRLPFGCECFRRGLDGMWYIGGDFIICGTETNDERLARFRLRVKCEMAVKK